MRSVAWLTYAPVKGLRLRSVPEVRLGPRGVPEDRRFYLIDAAGERVGALELGSLLSIDAESDPGGERLVLTLPSGESVGGEVRLGDAVTTSFYGRPVRGRVLDGPWSEAVSSVAGRALRVVRTDEPGTGMDHDHGAVTLVSEASVDELTARSAATSRVDARRFRMLVGVAGCRAHEEDEWIGRDVRVGDALIRLVQAVARCAITTKDPDTGERDFDALREILAYRGRNPETMTIDFGVVGHVVRQGVVRVGDPVEAQ